MEKELVLLGGAVVAALSGAILTWIVAKPKKQWVAWAEKISPDEFDKLAAQVASWAYDAVEEYARAFGEMTSEQKKNMAMRYIRKALGFLTGQTPPKDFAEWLLLGHIDRRRRDSLAVASKSEAVPGPERLAGAYGYPPPIETFNDPPEAS